MDGAPPIVRTWLIRVAPAEAQIRCSYQRVRKRVVRFAVQFEIRLQRDWVPVVRYGMPTASAIATPYTRTEPRKRLGSWSAT